MIQLGIDEVGRGSWAGPMVLVAVGFVNPVSAKDFKNIIIRDSKLLSANQREQAAFVIHAYALVEIDYILVEEIDLLGIQKAFVLGLGRLTDRMNVRIQNLPQRHECKFWIDGRPAFAFPFNYEYVIRGDMIMPIISAASIVAKVERDAYMVDMAKEYPQYGFDRHKGYGTSHHQAMLNTYGPCLIHRKSYKPIKNLLTAS